MSSIKTKMTLAVFLLVLALAFSTACITHFYYEKNIKESITNQQETLLSSIAENIDDKLAIAQNALIASRVLVTPEVIGSPDKAQRFLDSQVSLRSIFHHNLLLLSKDGKLIAESPYLPDRRGLDLSHREYFKQTVSTGKPYISDPFISLKTPGHPIISFTLPQFDSRGELTAILVGTFDLLQANILEDIDETKIGATGYLYLFNKNRTIIIHPDKRRIMTHATPVGTNKLFDKALAGFEGSGETINSRGIHMLASFKHLRTTNWVLAANYPVAEAYAPIYRARQYFLFGGIAAALFSALLAWAVMKYLTAPLVMFTQHVKDLSGGEGEQKLAPVLSNDEIGTLALAFNSMMAELEGQKKDLKKQVQFLEILMETIPNPIFYEDVEGRYIGCNSAFAALLGLSREQIIGKTLYDIAPKELAYQYQKADAELFSRQMSRAYEGTVVAKDGIVHSVMFYKSSFLNTDGTLGGLVTSMLDISEIRRAEDAIRASEAKYRQLHQSMMDGFVLVGMDREIKEFNESYRMMLGYGSEELVRLAYEDITPQQWHGFEQNIIEEQVLVRGYSDVYEKEYRKKDGTVFPIELRAFLIKDETDKNIGMWAIVRDISERRNLETQLRQSQKLEAVGTLAGGIAHDFNNILTTIVASASLMQRRIEDESPLRRQLDRIFSATERATKLTQSILAYSRTQVSNPAPVKVNFLVDNFKDFLIRLIPENIEFEVSLTAEDLIIVADAGQIEQVLMNLCTNALDAMSAGGDLAIRTESFSIDREFIAAHGYGKPGRYAALSIADSGIGMDENTRERIFEPFFTTKEVGKGTGLGLAMVYGIVKQHDGFINVYSEPGHGTTFRIYLPLVDAAVKASDSLDIRPQKGGNETVLVIEDDPLVRQILKDVLGSYGYRVIEAVDGAEGIAKFKEHQSEIHLVLTDVMMPHKNGKEAYDEIRKIREGIKVIFVSGYSAAATRELLDEGLTYLAKPFSPRELLKKMREELDT